MKKAVIKTGGKQYLVSEGETISVELLKAEQKNVKFETLLVIDDQKVTVGVPIVKNISVNVEVTEEDKQQDKVTSIRYKAKKRVHTVRGHRQRLTVIKNRSIK